MDKLKPNFRAKTDEEQFLYGQDRDHSHDTPYSGDLTGLWCNIPFQQLEINQYGKVYMCCPGWLPYSVGNILESSLKEIWHGSRAEKIRNSIANFSYEYCSKSECGHIVGRKLSKTPAIRQDYPSRINLSTDESCNLSCPSCRVTKVQYSNGEEYEKRLTITNAAIDQSIEMAAGRPLEFNITGSGDSFGSKIFRNILLNRTWEKNIDICFKTNAVMATPKMWDNISHMYKNIKGMDISIDAATSKTYSQVRRGGDFNVLMDNLHYISRQKIFKKHLYRDESFFFIVDFTVQKLNYREMPVFVDLIKRIPGITKIRFNIILDWGTYTPDEFHKQAVWQKTNELHEDFLDILKDPRLKDPLVDLGNVTEYWIQANSTN